MRSPIDTAVLMAGGQGMRLRPYTTVLPKPLMPLGDRPLVEILLEQLCAAGIERVLVSVNHLAHLIRAVLGHVVPCGVEISYQQEDVPLGTCGALGLMVDRLPARFLVVNGDLLSDYPISELMAHHVDTEAQLTIATRIAVESLDCGVIRRGGDGRVEAYVEKPRTEHELSIGLYAVEREIVETRLPKGAQKDMPALIQELLAEGAAVQALARPCDWIDIGRPEDYLRAQDEFASCSERFLGRKGEHSRG